MAVGIPVILKFTGEVNISPKGKALTIGVLKTDQLSMASKELLHITIAYHASMDFPANIIEHTGKWLSSFKTHHRTAVLTRWGEKSDLINGKFNIVVQEFRKLMGLKMNAPLHIELHQDNQHGHWGKTTNAQATHQKATSGAHGAN